MRLGVDFIIIITIVYINIHKNFSKIFIGTDNSDREKLIG